MHVAAEWSVDELDIVCRDTIMDLEDAGFGKFSNFTWHLESKDGNVESLIALICIEYDAGVAKSRLCNERVFEAWVVPIDDSAEGGSRFVLTLWWNNLIVLDDMDKFSNFIIFYQAYRKMVVAPRVKLIIELFTIH